MSSKLVLIFLFIALALAAVATYRTHNQPNSVAAPSKIANTASPLSFDFGNQKVNLDNQELTLVNGAYQSADQSHTVIIGSSSTSLSGTRAVATLVDNPGGSGTFYYLIAGMDRNSQQLYSQPILLGDRIKIVSVTVDDPQAQDNGEITINYLDHAKNAPMSADPTVNVTKKYAFQDDGNITEVLH